MARQESQDLQRSRFGMMSNSEMSFGPDRVHRGPGDTSISLRLWMCRRCAAS